MTHDHANEADPGFAKLADQGQDWSFITDRPIFERPKGLIDPPLELTVRMLRGIRMVDETSILIKSPHRDQ